MTWPRVPQQPASKFPVTPRPAPEPGADTTFTDVHLPGANPGGEGAAPNSGAPGSDAGRGTDA